MPLAVRGRPTLVPVDVIYDPVDVLLQLPGEPALADPGDPRDRDEPRPSFVVGCVEQVLEQAQLGVAPNERGFQAIHATAAPAHGDHADRAEGGHRSGLSAKLKLADRFGGDGRLGRAAGRLVNQDATRWGDGLKARCRTDQIAADQSLANCTQGDRCLAGHHGGPRGEPWTVLVEAHCADGVDEIEARPDGSFAVVLERRRCAPDGHDRVADELLDDPAIALDDHPGGREVAVLEVADLLGVATFGQCREPDQVGEQDRHDPTLGGRPGRPKGGLDTGLLERRAAFSAELGRRWVDGAARRATGEKSSPALVTELAARLVLG